MTFLRLLTLASVLGLIACKPAHAGDVFQFAFDDNGFTSPLAPFPPIVGTGTLTLASNLGDGTYTLSSLSGFTMLFNVGGDVFTQNDIASDPTQSEVVITNNGASAFFSDNGQQSGPLGGSIDFVNGSGDALSFSPSFFGAGFYVEFGESFFAGNYGTVPEPSSLVLASIASLVGVAGTLTRIRRKAKATAAA